MTSQHSQDQLVADLRARISALESDDDHRAMVEIHRILMAVGECPAIAEGDHYVVRLVKQLALSYNQLSAPDFDKLLEDNRELAIATANGMDLVGKVLQEDDFAWFVARFLSNSRGGAEAL